MLKGSNFGAHDCNKEFVTRAVFFMAVFATPAMRPSTEYANGPLRRLLWPD